MKPKTGLFIALFFLAGCLTVFAAGVDGKWTGEVEGPQGAMEVTFVFKAEGEKLTGTMSNQFGDAALHDGSIKSDDLSFKVTREFNGNKFTVKYTGKLTGDEIKLTRTFEGEGFGGQTPPPVTFTVKRAK